MCPLVCHHNNLLMAQRYITMLQKCNGIYTYFVSARYEHSVCRGSLRTTFITLLAWLFGSLAPAVCNRTSCAQVDELPQSHWGDNWEGTLFPLIRSDSSQGIQFNLLETTFRRLSFSSFILHVQFTIYFINVFTWYNLQYSLKAFYIYQKTIKYN